MLFVVNKPKLQRIVSLVRDDRSHGSVSDEGPFLRMEASGDQLRLTGRVVEATFPATVYEPGVLFLRVTTFRRVLRVAHVETIASSEVTIQVHETGMSFENVTLRFGVGDMLLYPDPDTAPSMHPEERGTDGTSQKPENTQGALFDTD